MNRNGAWSLIFHTLFVAFMLAPVVIVCVVAFTPDGFLSVPTSHFSFRWFHAIASYPEFIDAFLNSIKLAAFSASLAIGFSVPAAFAAARHRFFRRGALMTLFSLPLTIPHVVLGIAFLHFFTQVGLGGTFIGLTLSHIVIVFPFAFRLALISVDGLDRTLEQAAVSLGASDFTIFWRVTLPLIRPGLVAGWMLTFIQSFDEVTMTAFVAAPDSMTLPVRTLLYIQEGVDPLVAAVSALVIAITIVFVFVLNRLIGIERLLGGQGRG